jgi:phosphatidylinositol alpha-1,6-mannosyltransferase
VLIWHLSLLKLLPVLLAGQRTRIVLFLHGIEAWRRQSWLNRLLLRRVDLFLTNSSYTWDRFTRANPAFARSCQAVVELGLGRQLPMPSPRPGSPPVALMVGRLLRSEDYKGHRQVIDAWPQVVRAIPDAELWIVGDGDLRPELEQLVSMRRLERSVRFWGFISDHEKEALLTHSRCLVLPSTGEGFGLVYLEAMRLGRPCLVSAQDAGREVVNPPEAGLAVDPNQTRELAEAVRTLLTPGAAWDEWSAAAQARYANRFTARHFQARLLRALTPFLPASRPSAG